MVWTNGQLWCSRYRSVGIINCWSSGTTATTQKENYNTERKYEHNWNICLNIISVSSTEMCHNATRLTERTIFTLQLREKHKKISLKQQESLYWYWCQKVRQTLIILYNQLEMVWINGQLWRCCYCSLLTAAESKTLRFHANSTNHCTGFGICKPV